MHDPYYLLLALACVVNAGCAGCVFAPAPGRLPNQLAGTLLLGAAFWGVCELRWNQAEDAATALAWVRLSTPGWVFVGPVVLHLFARASGRERRWVERMIPALYAASAVFVVASWFTPWILRGAVRTSWGWGYQVGPLYPAVYATTIVGVLTALAIVARNFRESYSPAERRQQPWILAGTGVPLFVASVTDALLPVLGIQVVRLGTTSFAVLGVMAVWSFLRFGYSFLTPGTFADEMLKALPDGVALLQDNERIRAANDALARLSGYSRERLAGMHVTNLLTVSLGSPPEDVADLDCELRRASGERVPVTVSAALLCDPQDYAIGHVMVVRDLSEVTDLRRKLVMSARLAAVGELAAGVAHEINNPLAYVRANLTQLESHWKTVRGALGAGARGAQLEAAIGEGDELIVESLEGVDRAAEIVRGVRNFSHGGSAERELADPNQLLEDVLRMARAQLRGAEIERVYQRVPRVPCSPQELKQVFLNLIVNAGQAIREGGIVRLSTEHTDRSVWVHVEDDGCGIPPEIIDRVFDPFFTTKPVGEGTGLGLGIAYQIVRRHRGELTVESTPGVRTRFSVRLPLAEPSPAS